MRTLPMTFFLLALAMIGCGEAPPTSPAEAGASALKNVDPSSSQSELLDAVRQISTPNVRRPSTATSAPWIASHLPPAAWVCTG
jgi:hypothetical protein